MMALKLVVVCNLCRYHLLIVTDYLATDPLRRLPENLAARGPYLALYRATKKARHARLQLK
jgi:hypothetical protein